MGFDFLVSESVALHTFGKVSDLALFCDSRQTKEAQHPRKFLVEVSLHDGHCDLGKSFCIYSVLMSVLTVFIAQKYCIEQNIDLSENSDDKCFTQNYGDA